ncbi:hypothetical protein AMK29_19430 [Streptomyces sp. CB02261]|nr:hypothetical protein AMK29_19430 [Streptomyces sp. CB02261]
MPVGPTEDLRLSVSRLPGTTLFSVIADTFGHASHGMPPEWRRVIRDTAPPAAAATLRALLASSHPWAPDSLALTSGVGTGGGTGTATSITDELDRIEPDTLLGEVEHRFGSAVPAPWQHVAERPGEFVDTYRTLTRAVWDAFAPLWHQADALLGREVERVGVASVTGALDTLINDLGAPVRYADGRLHLPHPCPQHATGPWRRRFVLVPLASGFGACTYSAEDPDLLWVGYPLPGLGRLAHRSTEAHPRPRRTASTSYWDRSAPPSCATRAGDRPCRKPRVSPTSPSVPRPTTATGSPARACCGVRAVTSAGFRAGRCLDLAGATETDSTRLLVWGCHGPANQRWTLTS